MVLAIWYLGGDGLFNIQIELETSSWKVWLLDIIEETNHVRMWNIRGTSFWVGKIDCFGGIEFVTMQEGERSTECIQTFEVFDEIEHVQVQILGGIP